MDTLIEMFGVLHLSLEEQVGAEEYAEEGEGGIVLDSSIEVDEKPCSRNLPRGCGLKFLHFVLSSGCARFWQ
ncbi:MAG: hypothetical protein ABUJ92_11925, partial [Desulfobacterales bacterium]